jgi:hypothetical protein
MMRFASILTLGVLAFTPVVANAQNVPDEYRDEIRAVLLSGTISPDVDVAEFESFVDALSVQAYNANITGADLTSVKVEALLGAAAGFDAPLSGANTVRQPNVSVLWGTVAMLILIAIIGRYYRRMHNGGALGPVA